MEVKKHIIQHFISRFFFAVSGLLLNIVFSRLLGAANSGTLYSVINNYSIIVLVAGLSAESGMTYFSSRKEIDDRQLVSFSLLWTVLGTCAVLLLLAFLPGNFFSYHLFYTAFYAASFIAGSLLTTYFSALLFAKQEFLFPLLVPAITNFLLIVYCAWILFSNHETNDTGYLIKLYFIGYVINGFLLGIIYNYRYKWTVFFTWPSAQTIRKLFRYSSIALLANIIAFLAYRIDYWVLRLFMPGAVTPVALGNYIQVAKLVQLFLFVPTIVATVVFPVSASASDPGFHKKFKRMIGSVLLLNLILCVVVLICGKWAFPFLFGNGFAEMYTCFVFSVPAILAITVVRVLASYFAGTNRIKYNLAGGLIALVVITALNFLLVPRMGINGAALADSAGYVAYMILLLVFFNFYKNKPA